MNHYLIMFIALAICLLIATFVKKARCLLIPSVVTRQYLDADSIWEYI